MFYFIAHACLAGKIRPRASPWAETFLLIRKKRKQGCSTLNGKTADDIRMKCQKMQEMPSSRLRPQAKSLFPLPGLSLSPVALISSISQKARLVTLAHVVFGTLERRRVRGLASPCGPGLRMVLPGGCEGVWGYSRQPHRLLGRPRNAFSIQKR